MSAPAHECLSDALAAAQAEFAPVVKDKTAKVRSKKTTSDGRPIEYTYQYADLSDVIDAVTPALSKHGLAQVQRFRVSGNHQTLVTELRFKAEVLDSEIILPIANSDPQECGKIITYFRRYALQALLGITAERDDDAADTGHVRQPPARPQQRQAPPAGAPEDDRGERTYLLNGNRFVADAWIVEADRVARDLPPSRLGGFLEATKATRNEIYKYEADARARLMALSEDIKARALGAAPSEGAAQ